MQNSIGLVKSILIAAKAGEPMIKISEVMAHQGKGLEGDRYANNSGFWQTRSKVRESIRDVSFIRSFDIENSGFTEAETRRNIVIHTEINLLSLIGKSFYVGEALFKGIEDCTPCKRPSELSNKPNFALVFKTSGGLRAQVLKSGRIRKLDPVIVLSDSLPDKNDQY